MKYDTFTIPLIDSQEVYADNNLCFAVRDSALYRSDNGGAAWQEIRLAAPVPSVAVLAISPNFTTDGIAIVGTSEDGVFRSEDHGRTWAAWNMGLLDPCIRSLAFSPHFAGDGVILVGTSSGLFRSTNRGRSWCAVALPLEFTNIVDIELPWQAHGSDVWRIGTECDGQFISGDTGATWQQF